ncbi:P-loop containing nucleoside triphosphate hydrolase protein [Desarmillaria tabescens]|uniref:P-loop containing nucleoside triphosphate hydrolase protein n=1 Tax=Armillaria tabescens TaxID=1929756 RepID=A0AA39TL95_ARMTA|nr:P-loop containing nucleoside triphosphate hydrolase protein [Desarmillaria tabescens]KAK0463077.1 P-loop containing nucleoside triphosphate hydrolase protein [Desarmillaria tabescens]
MSNDLDARTARLCRIFDNVLQGKQSLDNQTSSHFLQALCLQTDPPACIDRILASKSGLSSLQTAFQSNTTTSFLDGLATDALIYLQNPDIRTISRGQFLTKALMAIVDPPNFWDAYVEAFKANQLSLKAQQCFAWMLHQLIVFGSDDASPYVPLGEEMVPLFASSPHLCIRTMAQKIRCMISLASASPGIIPYGDVHPGGRHDNDFPNFRQISILPTPDEIASTETPFLRPSWALDALDDPSMEGHRESLYLDNQFRLMREDMIHELRGELRIALGKQAGRKHRGLVVDRMKIIGVDLGDSFKRKSFAITFRCEDDLPQLRRLNSYAERKAYLKKNTRLLKHQSLTCLMVDETVLTFPCVRRDEELLAENPPEIVLEFEGEVPITSLLLKTRPSTLFKILQIDTALFAYEPVLNALKRMQALPLARELLFWREGDALDRPDHPVGLHEAVSILDKSTSRDLRDVMRLDKPIVLDQSQMNALLSGLTQRVSIIQGPPGTGKSFIGALLAKIIHDFSDLKILVVCYTNHALDQFLEDLLDVGIPIKNMVRMGGKHTPRTKPMALQYQQCPTRFTGDDYSAIDLYKREIEKLSKTLERSFSENRLLEVSIEDLMLYLERRQQAFHSAFQVPAPQDGMTIIDKKGRAVNEYYLLRRWKEGRDAGVFQDKQNIRDASNIWTMDEETRQMHLSKWEDRLKKLVSGRLCRQILHYNDLVSRLTRKFRERDAAILRSRQIIGCTTTAAAKYGLDLQAAAPDVVLVEEAGEVLESHVVTALGQAAKQLILIGDHKQLRPKVNNYELTVEKGEGYDLNRSLFERLVVKGYPHQTLHTQHRMRPEISALVRYLTYPDLLDAPKTQDRPPIRGLRDNVVFINHGHLEDCCPQISDCHDLSSASSKQNLFEGRMVLKIVKYLAQQGYGSSQIVVLTPYLAQLHKLQRELKNEMDPVLNDLDSHELIRAGLLTPEEANSRKRSFLRLATIDNYQGEESDIVIVSLTRSNLDHDIGFMSAPERINVLLSRARDGLIMIGNSDTFTQARKGKAIWQQLFAMLRDRGHIYDGLPVKCERHPYRTALISTESQFEKECPDGGCLEPCNAKLNCGRHVCPSLCHRLQDHSKMPCRQKVTSQCQKGHIQSKECSEYSLECCHRCANTGVIRQEKFPRKPDSELRRFSRPSLDRRTARQTPTLDARRPLWPADLPNPGTLEERIKIPSSHRKVLCPRSKPLGPISESDALSSDSDAADSTPTGEAKTSQMSLVDAKKNIEWGVDELFVTRTLAKAEEYFSLLPSKFHCLFVEKLVLKAAKSKRADAHLVAKLFAHVSSKHLSSCKAFEKGFSRVAKHSDDIVIDHPMAPELMALMIQALAFDDAHRA